MQARLTGIRGEVERQEMQGIRAGIDVLKMRHGVKRVAKPVKRTVDAKSTLKMYFPPLESYVFLQYPGGGAGFTSFGVGLSGI